ncbi:MAG: hypothetical protein ROR55_20245 [Devosia sp.]
MKTMVIGLRAYAATGVLALMASVASAQAPTEAQREAIRSNCVADYRANCSSIPPGGMASLVCLEQHEAQLSASCRSAVEAVKGPPSATATPTAKPTESAGKAATPKPEGEATTAPAPKPAVPRAADAAPASSQDQTSVAAPRLTFRQELRVAARSCLPDFRRFCHDVPIGHGNIAQCLRAHHGELDPSCTTALRDMGAVQ